jgi:signal transduction histidine kinase/CheY-like chemotaxis protein
MEKINMNYTQHQRKDDSSIFSNRCLIQKTLNEDLFISWKSNLFKILDSLNVGYSVFNLLGNLIQNNKYLSNLAKDLENEDSSIVNFDELFTEKLEVESNLIKSMSEEDMVNFSRKVSNLNTFEQVEDLKVKYFIENLLSNLIELKELFIEDVLLKDKNISKFSKKKFVDLNEFIEIFKIKPGIMSDEFHLIGTSKMVVQDDLKYFELKVRFNLNESGECCEFLLCDVTRIKEGDIIKSQLKYKSLGLAKVAHEFKNPIFTISTLLKEIDEQNLKDKNKILNSNQNTQAINIGKTIHEKLDEKNKTKSKYADSPNSSNSPSSPGSPNTKIQFHKEYLSEISVSNNENEEESLPKTSVQYKSKFGRNNSKCKTHKPFPSVLTSEKMSERPNTKTLIENLCNYLLVLIEDFNSYAKLDIEKAIKQNNIAGNQMYKNMNTIQSEKYPFKEFELIPMLEFCINIFKLRQKYENKQGLSIELKINDDVPRIIVSNEMKLKQIIVNLLSNSYKFTLSGKIILSAFLEKENKLKISIEDTGIGMTQEEMNSLFCPFKMLDAGKGYNQSGTGLGLLIVKDTLIKLNAKIQLESNKGQGCHFWFDLPIDPLHMTSSLISTSQMDNNDETSIIEQNFIYTDSLLNIFKVFCDSSANNSINIIPDSPPKKTKNLLESNIIFEDLAEDSFSLYDDHHDNNPKHFVLNRKRSEKDMNYVNRVMKKFSNRSVNRLVKDKNVIVSKATKKFNILLCDDDLIILSSVKRLIIQILKNYNIEFEVDTISSGIECLYLIYNERKNQKYYDLLIIDESMPFMRGSLVVKNLKSLISENEMKDICIYVCSSYEDSSVKNQILSSGCNDILKKPLKEDVLLKIFMEHKYL